MVNKNNLQKVWKLNYLGTDIFLMNSLGGKQFWSWIKLLPLYIIVGSPTWDGHGDPKRNETKHNNI